MILPPSMLPRAHIAEQESRHFAFLDLLTALGDAVAAMMPVDMLERLMARIAHSTMHLHGAIGGLTAQPVCPEVAHRHLVRQRMLHLRLSELIHFPRRLPDQQPQHLRLRGEFDQRPLDRLVLRQRMTERLALARVFDTLLNAINGGSKRTRGLSDPILMHKALCQ